MDFLIDASIFVSSLGAAYYLYQRSDSQREKARHNAYITAVENYMRARREMVNSLVAQGKSLPEISKNIEDLVGTDYPSPDDFDI